MRTLSKILIGLVLAAIAVAVLLAFTGVFIARTFHVTETGSGHAKTVVVNSPMGAMTIHARDALKPESIGIPVYPGATQDSDNGGADFELDSGDVHRDMSVHGASFSTSDSLEQVRDFYHQKFPSWNIKLENDSVKIETHEGFGIRVISMHRDGDRTRIGVASFGPSAAN